VYDHGHVRDRENAGREDPGSENASFGVCHSSITATPDEISAAADAALYRPKTSGRNRVINATDRLMK
jgi:PleD family two-component response regulator